MSVAFPSPSQLFVTSLQAVSLFGKQSFTWASVWKSDSADRNTWHAFCCTVNTDRAWFNSAHLISQCSHMMCSSIPYFHFINVTSVSGIRPGYKVHPWAQLFLEQQTAEWARKAPHICLCTLSSHVQPCLSIRPPWFCGDIPRKHFYKLHYLGWRGARHRCMQDADVRQRCSEFSRGRSKT